ncbi:MAG TPA: hypothetical protein DFS52_16890 [Myxococcales bacterium]|nr:hypothetical protein [Myxococcales bacterium]
MRRFVVVVAATSLAAGCASSKGAQAGNLSTAEAAVRLMKSDPPPACTEAGQVLGKSIRLATQTVNMKRQAAALGANYVRLEGEGSTGTAFRCPPELFGPTDPSAAQTAAPIPEEQVRLMKSDPPFQCVEAGQVLGKSMSLASQKANMKRQAAAMGANYVRLEGQGGTGTAFRCPPELSASAPASAQPAAPIPEEKVRLLKSDPPPQCVEAGQVLGKSIVIETQQANMKRQAAEMGANYVRLVEGDGGTGTAFRCPDEVFAPN